MSITTTSKSTTRRKPSAKAAAAKKQARTEKLEALHTQMTDGLAELVAGDGWAAMLATAARFHRYSLNNVMLIQMQRPDATRVAGFGKWKELGRTVRKGETGIAILAPATYRATSAPTAAEPTPAAEVPEPRDEEGTAARVLRGFTIAHVFDVSQTDGDELPDVRPTLLAGERPHELWDALAAQVAAAGYRLREGNCKPANGLTRFGDRVVVVRDDLEGLQQTKTLAHELAHVLLHDPATFTGTREQAEIEAESVAYIVCQASGITTAEYTLPYVAGWAGGDVEKVKATAARVLATARRVLDTIETST